MGVGLRYKDEDAGEQMGRHYSRGGYYKTTSVEGFGLLKDKCAGTIRQNHLIICRMDMRMKSLSISQQLGSHRYPK
jgi:hypothetical protein